MQPFDAARLRPVVAIAVLEILDGMSDVCRAAGRPLSNQWSGAEHLKLKKKIYEKRHPETKAGVAGAKAKHSSATDILSVASFADDAATNLATTDRSIRREVAIADGIPQDVRGRRVKFV